MRPTRRTLFVALPAALLAAAAAVALAMAFWSAQRTLTRSAGVARTQHDLAFTLRPLDPANAQSENPGFEPVSSPSAYTAGAWLGRDLYLAGPAGLSIMGPDGSVRRTLRTGLELPVAPIVAVASGRLRGSSDSQILLATSGAGLLLLTPDPLTIRQLLPDSADARDLSTLLPLASGDLLLGTRHHGLLAFNGATLAPYGGLPAAEITTLATADAASILVGTRNAGLFYLRGGSLQHATGLPDEQVESIAVAEGKAFVGTPLGVAQFNLASSETTFKPERILAPGLFAHTLSVAGTDLLVGTLDQGIQRIPLSARPRLRNAAFDATQSTQRVDAFLSSQYALADGVLLGLGESGSHAALSAPADTLADRNISALAFAPDGSLYVGFFDHGLDILNPHEPAKIRHLEDDHLFCVNRLALDPVRQTIAAATANGLVLFDRQGIPRQTLTRRDGLISDHINDLIFSGGGMTVATPAGLTFMSPAGAESLYAFQGLVNNHVYTVSTAGSRLLAGTLGGISIVESGSVKRSFTAANSTLKHNWITALAPVPQGGWLVGTYGAGVEMLDNEGHFTPVELPAGSPRDLVINPNALLVTATHSYAGTLAHGMLVYSNASQRWTVVTKGLPSLNVTAFAERDGELYVGTENGLVRIAEAKL